MKIAELKSRLNILDVAEHLGIVIERGKKALCPFHDDKKPSMQFSEEKQICTCFSSNCPEQGSMDVIDLVSKYKKISTGEAIKYLQNNFLLLTEGKTNSQQHQNKSPRLHITQTNPVITISEELRVNTLNELFTYFEKAIIQSKPALAYLEGRYIDPKKVHVGFNSGSFRTGKSEDELAQYTAMGLLKHRGGDQYLYFGKGCVVFPLKNKKGGVAGLYFRETDRTKTNQHYYLTNRQGLYPGYPSTKASRIILTESIIDAATLQTHLPALHPRESYEILACYGTEGVREQVAALKALPLLEEVIIFFDGDEAGNKGRQLLKDQLQPLKVSYVDTPAGEDVNSLLDSHSAEVLLHLIESRKPAEAIKQTPPTTTNNSTPILNTDNPLNLVYIGDTASYAVKGGVGKQADAMKVSLVIQASDRQGDYSPKLRCKLDLYEYKQSERMSKQVAEKLHLSAKSVEEELNVLCDLLDEYRHKLHEKEQVKQSEKQTPTISASEQEKCLTFLKKSELVQQINELIGKSGVVGELNNRIFLFCIAASYKMPDTLHALIQGSSGSGKTHLLATIMGFMPNEDTVSLTRVTESSLYNYGSYELQHKLIGLEDYDGLEEKAELAFRELQSKGEISSSTSGKNEQTGEITGFVKTVYGPIASLSATTRGEIYEDNMSRCFLVAVDESKAQTMRIIRYQNDKAAGQIDRNKEVAIRKFLQSCMRLLKPYQVINPYANKIDLPSEAHKIRRLNDLFQSFVRQVTLLNQYQRQKTPTGELITEKEDVKTAIEIMFDSIILKVDELDGSLRSFYEDLKGYVLQKGEDYEFEQREIRLAFRMSKTQMHRHIHALSELEYIYKTHIGMRNTFRYKIAYWDNIKALRHRIKQDLHQQLEQL